LFKTRNSIAFRLIAAVLAVELFSSIAVIFLALGYERHTHFIAFDIMLRGRADSLLVAVQDSEDPQANVIFNQTGLRLPPDDVYEVYDQSGRLLGRSNNWQGTPQAVWNNPTDGYMRLRFNNRHYRVLRIHGSRFVDATEPGGGKLRPVTILYGAPTEMVWHAIRGAVEFYAAGSLLLLVVTGPLIAWLLHRGLLPLRQLATLASRVSVDSWQFSPPDSARATPELAPLTHALESVLQRLERSFQQQRAFVSDAAHELKTSVAVIKSSLQLLGMKRRTTEEYKAGLERCLVDCQRMEEIVSGMLTLAREESAAPRPDAPSPTADLAASLHQVVAQLETVARVRGIQVAVAPALSGDETVPDASSLLVPIASEDCALFLSNLLLNALQHSPSGSLVEARLTRGPESVTLQIEDHGEGIDPAALPHVFDRFFRGDPSRTRSTGGTGLGLSIVKAVVEKAGGSISIASQPSLGTTVTARLPLVLNTARQTEK
jgi:signal transduction histidine kinase